MQSKGGGWATKSTASIPMLEENISETQWAAWKARFNRYCVSDQIVVNLIGDMTKDALLAKIKAAVVKKRSIFLYRKDFHQLTQSQGEDPKRFAA